MLTSLLAAEAALCAIVLGAGSRIAKRAGSREVIVSDSQNACPEGYSKLTSPWSCRAALDILGPGGESGSYPGYDFQGEETDAGWPSGCYECRNVQGCTDGVWYNHHAIGSPNGGARPICAKGLEPLRTGGVLFIGDSDVDYWLESSTTAASAPLPAHNVAVGGFTCKNVLNGNLDATLAAFQPSVVVLVCGENDLGGGASVNKAFSRFQNVVTQLHDGGARVIYMGTKDEPDTSGLWNKYAKYDAKVQALATELAEASSSSAAPLAMVDVNAGFKAMGNPSSFYAADALHLSAEGYSHWDRWVGFALRDPTCALWLSDACVLPVTATASMPALRGHAFEYSGPYQSSSSRPLA